MGKRHSHRHYTPGERLQGSGGHSWGDQFAASKKYVAGLSHAQRIRHIRNMLLTSARREQTDAYLKGSALSRAFSEADYEEAVGELLDEGLIRATVIDGREFGFVPGLVRTGKGT